MIRGQLVRTVWHQGALARAHALDHCQKLRRRIAFHIQFAALLLTHRLQRLHIPVTGMPLILTRMQRDPMRAQAQATHGECTNIREILPPRIAQQGNLVDVDRQLCQREVSCAGRISIARPFESAARTPIAERCTCCVSNFTLPEDSRAKPSPSSTVYITSSACAPRGALNSSSSAVVPAFCRRPPDRARTSTGACILVAIVNGVYPLIHAINMATAFSFRFIERLISISLG